MTPTLLWAESSRGNLFIIVASDLQGQAMCPFLPKNHILSKKKKEEIKKYGFKVIYLLWFGC